MKIHEPDRKLGESHRVAFSLFQNKIRFAFFPPAFSLHISDRDISLQCMMFMLILQLYVLKFFFFVSNFVGVLQTIVNNLLLSLRDFQRHSAHALQSA